MSWNMDEIFDLIVERKASDVIFVPGSPPMIWVSGIMQSVEAEPLTAEGVEAVFLPLLNEDQRRRLQEVGDIDFAVPKAGVGRLRLNVHRQRGSLSVAARFVPQVVPLFEQLKLPPRVLKFADLPCGLVLVTGGAAMGKSTTLAAMIEHINRTYAYHIITLEDPVEYLFHHNRSIIEQREIGVDCPSFASALRHVVRQRPDVIMVGEMRDLETISAALTAAETGQLVLASLHTIDTVETIDRIIDIFPAAQQTQVRAQLAGTLRGVIAQRLFHDSLDGGLIPAVEIMVITTGVRRAIRERETHLLPGMIETGRALGMQAMDTSIAKLVAAGHISSAEALSKARDSEKLTRLIA